MFEYRLSPAAARHGAYPAACGNGGESLEQTHFNHIINGDFIQQKRIREEKTRQEVREATAQRGTQSQQGRQLARRHDRVCRCERHDYRHAARHEQQTEGRCGDHRGIRPQEGGAGAGRTAGTRGTFQHRQRLRFHQGPRQYGEIFLPHQQRTGRHRRRRTGDLRDGTRSTGTQCGQHSIRKINKHHFT